MNVERNGRQRPEGFEGALEHAALIASSIDTPSKLAAIRAITMCAELDDAQRVALTLHVIMATKDSWAAARPVSTLSTRLFASLTGWSVSKVIRVHGRLEDGFWLARHYTPEGHRAPDGAYDLRMLWANLEAVDNSIRDRFEQQAARRKSPTFIANMPGGGVKIDRGHNTYEETKKLESVEDGLAEQVVPVAEVSPNAVKDTGYYRPVSRTPTPIHGDAVSMVQKVSDAFAEALRTCAFNAQDPDRLEVLDATRHMASSIGVPAAVIDDAIPRHGYLTVAAVLAVASNRARHSYPGRGRIANAVGWVRANLARDPEQIDIWASVHQDRSLMHQH